MRKNFSFFKWKFLFLEYIYAAFDINIYEFDSLHIRSNIWTLRCNFLIVKQSWLLNCKMSWYLGANIFLIFSTYNCFNVLFSKHIWKLSFDFNKFLKVSAKSFDRGFLESGGIFYINIFYNIKKKQSRSKFLCF